MNLDNADQVKQVIQILNLTVGFVFQTHVSGGVIKNILVSVICVTFNLDARKVSFLNYL